jgi:hypothetical protein
MRVGIGGNGTRWVDCPFSDQRIMTATGVRTYYSFDT